VSPSDERLFIGLTASRAESGAAPAARIERQLALCLLERHPDVAGFCAYDAAAGDIVPLSRDEAGAWLAGRLASPAPAAVGRRRGRVERYLMGPARRLLLPKLAAVPAPLRAPLSRFLSSARLFVSTGFGVAAAVLDALPRRPAARPQPEQRAAIAFTAQDMLVLPSVAWDQPGLFACAFRHRRASGVGLLVYCDDASPLDRPQLLAPDRLRLLQAGFVDMAWSATRIVCATEATRATLRRFIAAVGLPARPLGVIHPGIDPPGAPPDDRPASLPPVTPGRFALVVAAIEPGCNHQLLYDLWVRLAEEIPDRLVPLLFVGAAGRLSGDLIGIIRDDERMRGRLFVLPDQSDPTFAWLYHNCAFTLHPTLAGGWPRALVDSLALGKYCVASAVPANAELSQGLLDLIDPLDFMAWHDEVRRLLTEPDHLAARERRIAAFRPRAWSSACDALTAEIVACRAAGASA
jgi:glycosyltransferase involved in cell wall biosynthesis